MAASASIVGVAMGRHTYSPHEIGEAFQAAAFGQHSWADAMQTLADATGSRTGQLVGFGSEAAVPFNLMTNMPDDAGADWIAVGGGDPMVNSRVRVGSAAAELQILDERHFTTADDIRQNPDYADWVHRTESAYTCLTPLVRRDSMMVGMAVIRTQTEGQIDDDQRRLFAAAASAAQTAVRTQLEIETQGIHLLANTLEAVSVCAFICDVHGRVRAMSPRAEDLVAEGKWLDYRHGRLFAKWQEETRSIEAALMKVIDPANFAGSGPFVIHSEDWEPLPLEAVPLPTPHAFRFSAAVMLIARPLLKDETRAAALSQALFGLTSAEASVVANLAAGRGPQAIAERRGVSVGTIRTHVRRIFDKAGVGSLLELMALMGNRS